MSKNPHAETTFFLPALTKAEQKESSTILLIDDNAELVEFLTTGLPDYKISRAINSVNILQQAYDLAPDLIIVSATLPVITSYECCRNIKEDKRTSQIPVILLIENVISDACTEALTSRADDYLIKPFSREELELRVKKIFINKHRLQKTFNQELNTPVTTEKKAIVPESQHSIDPFFKNVYAIIEEKFGDSTFGVKELATQVGMSKVSLYRKLKLLTGMSPVNLITQYRLQRAALYLKQGSSSSETATKSGFGSAAYFTKCFRKLYKFTPRRFSQQKP